MMTGKRQNSIHFFVILGLLVSLIWPVAQATAHASQAQAAPASQAAPQTPPDKPEKPPVDPALTALDRPAKSADPQAASQPQMNTPQAYSYTYEWTGTQTIVDNSCSGTHQFISLAVADSFNVTNLSVGFNAAHNYRSDVQMWIVAPDSTRVQLVNGANGGSADNFDVLFKTGGSTTYTGDHMVAAPYYEYVWAPQGGDLATLVGKAAQGNWQMEVCDDDAAIDGTVNRWALFFNEIASPNLQASVKMASVAMAQPGDTLAYTIILSNTGNLPASSLSVTDPLPAGLSYVSSATPGLTYNSGSNQVEWSGSLAVGSQTSLQFTVQVDSGVACGTQLTNTATISDPLLPTPVEVKAATQVSDNLYLWKDFEADNGGFTASGTASSWAWGVPTSGPGKAHSGAKVWATNLAGNYTVDEVSYLTSPVIDLGAAVPGLPAYPLMLDWWQWLHTEAGYDFASVEARGGSADWTVIYGPVDGAVDAQWTRRSADISAFAGVSDFQVRFKLESDVSGNYPGWYIDDLSIVQCTPEPGLYLSPDSLQVTGCNGLPSAFDLKLVNLTGSDGTFDLSYAFDSAYGTVTGPASLPVANKANAQFSVTLEPKVCLPDGVSLNASVTASGNGYSDATTLEKTITTKGEWATKAAMTPGGLYDHAVVDGGNGSLYALGGNGQATKLNLRYDMTANSWSSAAALPSDLRIIDGGQIDGKIYLPGGYNGTTFVGTTLAYDVAANTWMTMAVAPRLAAGYGVAACGGKLYRVGGALYDTFPNGETGAEVYDPASNAWTALAPMTAGHTWPGVACLNDKLYVAGGIDASGGDSTVAEVYDIASNTWSDAGMADLPLTRWGSADFTLNGKFYMAGGIVDGSTSASVVAYSPDTNTWQEASPLADARFRLEGDSSYAVGGMEPVWEQHTSVEKYSSCPECTEKGTLSGKVFDYDGTNPPATAAAVTLQPGNLTVPVDAAGNYSASLVPFAYQATASAANYPQADGPHAVNVTASTTTVQNFTLPRPDIEVNPTSLTGVATAPGTDQKTLQVFNHGTLPLEYRFLELPGASTAATPAARPSQMQERDVLSGGQIEVEPQLRSQMALDEKTSYLVYFRQKPDLSQAASLGWKERGRWVVERLMKTAERSQANVRAYLDSQRVEYTPYWIDNVILVKSSNAQVFNRLQSFGEVAALRARRQPILYEPESVGQAQASTPMAVQSNLNHVLADQVWSLGFSGQGIVVANIDTGVNYTHEALVQHYRGNLGGGVFDHNHNWYDPASGGTHLLVPEDHDSHGSHTMGTMIGSTDPANPAAAANTIGMAPGAEWIACRAFEDNDQEILDCAQFLAAPTETDGVTDPNPDLRPNLINNSWGDCTTTYDPWFDTVLSNWHALGIYPIFSNGNASNCSYSSPPGLNTVGSPARAGNVTGVGATGRSDGQYATFSNWGPTDQEDTINPLGYPRLKPQVVAPGTNRSAANTGNTYMDMSGTSMAAPHVSGLVALMWSAAPCLVGDYAQTETILEQTANPVPYASGGTPAPGPGNVPNYATGWGEINALAAVNAAISACNTDWLPWVTFSPITGTLTGGASQTVQVDFNCTLTDTLKPQPLTGVVRVIHNDPTQDALDVNVALYCSGAAPIPTWNKEVWINGQKVAGLAGPHTVRPGDSIVVVDRVGAAFSGNVSATLTDTWGAGLTLLSANTAGVGQVTNAANQLTWQLTNVAPNATYPITKTFQASYAAWTSDTLAESYQVQNEVQHLANKNVGFTRYVPAITLDKSGPTGAQNLEVVPVTLTLTSSGSLFGSLTLTDSLPAGMTYQGGVTATFGTPSVVGNVIHWSGSAVANDVVADGSFETGKTGTAWTQASTNFGSPLCDATCGGPDAHTGDWFVWFGGISSKNEAGSVEQSVTIPSGKATLSFWLLGGVSGGTGWMHVMLDGTEVFTLTQADIPDYSEYTQVNVDVSSFADGAAHTLRFESQTFSGGNTNFFVDDVSLLAGDPLPAVIQIGFKAQVSGPVGAKIANTAYLDWGADHTSDQHVVEIMPLPTFGLTVSKSGSGTGSVTSAPAGIDCGATCTHNFEVGTVVTLTATAGPNAIFAGWSGACTGAGACVVTMDAAKNVTATFNPLYKRYLPLIAKPAVTSALPPSSAARLSGWLMGWLSQALATRG